MNANPLMQLEDLGQAVWLDFVERDFINDGHLRRLVDEDGLKGVTSNPSIFEKAIAKGGSYDETLRKALDVSDLDAVSLYERMAIEDIRAAADILHPVYDKTSGSDGYVSLEVSPYLAMNTDETVAEARRLWIAVGRPNLMIKVPGTAPGLPAIRQLVGEGLNINITLLFSQTVYEEVAEAYLAGLERFVAGGGDPRRVASVASFFVSRIDTAVDNLIDERLHGPNDAETRAALEGIKGKVAIANAKLAYQRYLRLFSGPRWERLKAQGARPQRLLWASTGTKNKAYSDVLYVESLIGSDTVNTLPPATMDAFRAHGTARPSLEEDIAGAETVMATLERLGLSIDEVTDRLVEQAVDLFVEAADGLLGVVAQKRAAFLGPRLNAQTRHLPEGLEAQVAQTLDQWTKEGNVRRLWQGDPTVWTGDGESRWLGWLDIADEQALRRAEFRTIAERAQREGFAHALLLGMGGSSLGPEVLAETFGRQDGGPELLVLDSTDPAQIRAFERRIDPARALFIVSSKSGTTLEPNILKDYFFERARQAVGNEEAGSRFVAITDPGSALESQAREERFRHVFHGRADIGGRYSVLSDFGLVPGAVMGLDIGRFLDSTRIMVRSCADGAPPKVNPGAELGVVLGTLARTGRDKVTIFSSPGIADLGAWLEQLLAESTGKQRKGLIPVDLEPLVDPDLYNQDRIFVYLRLESAPDAEQDRHADGLEGAGQPLVRIRVSDPIQIGQEFFRWEIATAVAGAILGINPFDQPDVEASKVRTRTLMEEYEKTGQFPAETPIVESDGIRLFADKANADALRDASGSVATALAAHLARLHPGDYCALLAYVERDATNQDFLTEIRRMVLEKQRVATCLGFGPRFLHSTGQAYKGGPGSGVFLQITSDEAEDLPIPGRSYTFGMVKAAQARGDFEVLAERGRRALRVHLGADVPAGLARLRDLVRDALA